MKAIIQGAPSVGKTTVVREIQKRINILHVNIGQILKADYSEFIQKGLLIPDPVVNNKVSNILNTYTNDLIFDGYPRNLNQATYFNSITTINSVINITLSGSREELYSRLIRRMTCPCGENYHLTEKPPVKKGICDYCGDKLYVRKDQTYKTTKHRIDDYFSNANILLSYYQHAQIPIITASADDGVKGLDREVTKIVEQMNCHK